MSNSKRDLIDWFDIENPDHIKAYIHLQEKGYWPKDFFPENGTLPDHWHMKLQMKLSNGYVKKFKNETGK
jgi:hypothetical protein